MINAIYAEFRKLLTVRSTYFISGVALLFSGGITAWGLGYDGKVESLSTLARDSAFQGVNIASVFVGIVAILTICHEYRYGTIAYTLTSTNSRLKVLVAKFFVTGVYGVVMTILAAAFVVGLTILGAKLAKHNIGTQTLDLYSVTWKIVVYMLGTVWFGLILGFLARNVVFAIVAYFVIPTLEPLLHNLLKISNNYLPSASQSQILLTTSSKDVFSPIASAEVFAIYLAIGLLVSMFLFLRKDAN